MSALIETASKLTNFVNSRTKLAAQLKKAGYNGVTKATKTRWYSLVNMLESLFLVKDELVKILEDSTDEEMRTLLEDIIILHEISDAIRILRLLANCIAVAEKADGSIGETVKAVLEFARSLLRLDWGNSFVIAAINSFFTYFSSKKLGNELYLMIAAYCLDRRNKCDYLTEAAFEKSFLYIRAVARKSGYKTQALKLLSRNFADFCRQKNEYSTLPRGNESSHNWWMRIPCKGVLKNVAIRLANLKPSSANCERTFSDVKQRQCPNRTNYRLETIKNILIVSLAIKQEVEIIDDEGIGNQMSSQIIPSNSRRDSSSQFLRQVETSFEESYDDVEIENSTQWTIISEDESVAQEIQGLSHQMSRLRFDNKTAYREFMELIDFNRVNRFKDDKASRDEEEADEEDGEALEDFRSELNSRN